MNQPETSFSHLATVTVTYNPELAVLERQLDQLPTDAVKILVDNASDPEILAGLRAMQAATPRAILLENSRNQGLSAALDRGVRYVLDSASHCSLVLLLDQDSEPETGSIQCLIRVLATLESAGLRPGAVGPQLRDADSGNFHGFHQMSTWRWRRIYPPITESMPIPVASLNGSGTLMPLAVYLHAGGLDHTLFIDHVDTDWSFRLLDKGYSLWGVPEAAFTHRMGERGLRYWLAGWRVWPQRSPLRHRYLFRNTLWLIFRPYVPKIWKTWAVMKLALTVLVCAAIDPRRVSQLKAMWQGLREGFRRRSGA